MKPATSAAKSQKQGWTLLLLSLYLPIDNSRKPRAWTKHPYSSLKVEMLYNFPPLPPQPVSLSGACKGLYLTLLPLRPNTPHSTNFNFYITYSSPSNSSCVLTNDHLYSYVMIIHRRICIYHNRAHVCKAPAQTSSPTMQSGSKSVQPENAETHPHHVVGTMGNCKGRDYNRRQMMGPQGAAAG